MITFLIEMLELPNFGHITTSWKEIVMSQSFFQNTFVSRRPSGGNFANIIKIVTIFIENL